MNRYLELLEHGQSLWLDYIDRNLVINGGLKALVDEGLRGVTSNPTIFHKAVLTGEEYDEQIRELVAADHEIDELLLYRWITLQDIQMTADILRGVYDSSGGEDGYVSLEVPPDIAHDTIATVRTAQQLWNEIQRPNLMIKVPATREGLPAIERLLAGGINVNVTLLFSTARYEEVLQAILRGLTANPEPRFVATVASFFVSRIDSKIDPLLAQTGSAEALALQGRIAIANAKMAYQIFKRFCQSAAYKEQRNRGARIPRLLWGSTGTKNPAYSDVLYVEQLIGPHTVNTVPPGTLDALLHHAEIRSTLDADLEAARRDLAALQKLGIDLAAVTQQLEVEGVASFADSYTKLLAALKHKCLTATQRFAGSEV
ncbi:MAG: transaldolase [Pseudomonadota bacterium]